jgi:hypothetical protein
LNLGPGPIADNVPPLPRYIGKEVGCSKEAGKVVCCTGAIVVTTVGDTGEGTTLSDKAKLLPLLLALDDDSTEFCRMEEAEEVDNDKGGATVDVFSDELEVEPLIDN